MTPRHRSLAELVEVPRRSQDPQALGEQQVEHFSIPAFDQGARPEVVAAEQIRSNKLALAGPAVLLSKINPHIPRCWLAEPSGASPALASTEFIPLVPRLGEADLGYLYAVCSSRPFQRKMASMVTGTSSSHQRVKPRDCLAISVPVPAWEEQVRIGRVFRSLTERAQVTNGASQLADELVRAQFREHFGDGLGSTPLAEVAEVSFGVSYRSADLRGTSQALVTLKCFGRNGGYRSAGLKAWSGEPKAEQIVHPGDVVVAQTDLTQAADVLGRCLLVRRSPLYDRLVASLDVAIVRPRVHVSREYLYGLFLQPEFRRHCRARANGTTVLHLGRKAVPEYRVRVPDADDCSRYEATVRAAIERLVMDEEEALLLEELRESFIISEFGR